MINQLKEDLSSSNDSVITKALTKTRAKGNEQLIDPLIELYTKTENSQSFFCAGYYVVHWEDGSNSPSYCPKLITLSRYEFDGPFKTRIEMQETLRRANG